MPDTPVRCANGDLACELGTWLDSAVRNVPVGPVTWQGIPRRVYTASVGRTVLGTVRRALNQPLWLVSVPGFVWDVRGDKGSSTTRQLNIETSPSRGFKSSQEARRAVEAVYSALLWLHEQTNNN